MNRLRRALSLTLALCVTLLALAGCSSKDSNSNPANNSPNNSTTIPTGKSVEVTLLLWPGINREAIDEVVWQYQQKHPNVRVRVQAFQTIGGSNFNASVLKTVDIALLPQAQVIMAAQAGALRDLSAVRIPQLNDEVAHLFDDLSKLDGKRYGLPFEFKPAMMTLFEQTFTSAGLRVPPIDWTLQEFEQVLQGLKNAGLAAMVSAEALLAPVVAAYGGQAYNPHSGRWLLDTEEAKQGLAYLARLTQAGLISAGSAPGGGGGATAGVGGAGGNPALVAVPSTLTMMTRVPVAQQPYPKGPRGRSVPTTATMAVVSASSTNTEVAIDFVREMIGSETAQLALAKGGIRPVVASSKALAAWQNAVGDKAAQKVELSLRGAYADLRINFDPVILGLLPYLQGRQTLDQVLPGLLSRLNS